MRIFYPLMFPLLAVLIWATNTVVSKAAADVLDAVLIQQSDHLTGNGKIGIFDSVWKKKNGQALFPFPGMVSKATPHNSRLTA